VNLGASVSAPVIIASDVMGGPGTGSDYGFYVVSGNTLGSLATNVLSITAGSLGTGSNEYGINLSGTLQVGNGGTMTLNGTGGGVYSGAGTNNHGIFFNAAVLLAGTDVGTGQNTINVTGMGGSGSGGSHFGVSISNATIVYLSGTNPANALNFINCIGGLGGNLNHGVSFAGNLTMVTGTLK
jgi:hypothetical protein